MKNGIDVSEFNGTISWDKVDTDFVFIRGGIGDNTIDTQFYNNAKGCAKHNIPFGIYWMSYAVTEYNATVEADSACDLADGYGKIPIAFDFEADSDRYARSIGYNLSNVDRANIALAFLKRVTERGFIPILYTNWDYYNNKGFDDTRLTGSYKYWYAQYGVDSPAKINASMCIWQYGQKNINGIGNTDVNIMYVDIFESDMLDKMIHNFDDEQFTYYLKKAVAVINGDYGDGNERVKLLRKDGYDAEITQFIVNKMLALLPDINSYLTKEQYPYYKTKAVNYKNGSYGNDKEAKKYLNSKGYDFEIIKHM